MTLGSKASLAADPFAADTALIDKARRQWIRAAVFAPASAAFVAIMATVGPDRGARQAGVVIAGAIFGGYFIAVGVRNSRLRHVPGILHAQVTPVRLQQLAKSDLLSAAVDDVNWRRYWRWSRGAGANGVLYLDHAGVRWEPTAFWRGMSSVASWTLSWDDIDRVQLVPRGPMVLTVSDGADIELSVNSTRAREALTQLPIASRPPRPTADGPRRDAPPASHAQSRIRVYFGLSFASAIGVALVAIFVRDVRWISGAALLHLAGAFALRVHASRQADKPEE